MKKSRMTTNFHWKMRRYHVFVGMQTAGELLISAFVMFYVINEFSLSANFFFYLTTFGPHLAGKLGNAFRDFKNVESHY